MLDFALFMNLTSGLVHELTKTDQHLFNADLALVQLNKYLALR